MKWILKNDWEIARIFLILALLTFGFVWALQGLILPPPTMPHMQSYSQKGLEQEGKGSRRGDVFLEKSDSDLGVFDLSLLKKPTPLRSPASFSIKKRNQSTKN